MNSKIYSPLVLVLVLAMAALSVFAERLPVKTYTSVDGLGSGFVDSIFRDSRGFMWFCTRDGLSRFDGSRFVNYQIEEKGTSPGVESIFEARNGDYWVSTTSGTYRFNPNENSLAGKSSSNLNAEYVSGSRGSFIEDRNGTLWMASGTLMRLEVEDGKRTFKTVDWKIPQKPNTTFSTFRVLEADDGSLWLFTSWGIARKLPDGRMVVYTFDQQVYGGNGSVEMIIDKGGRIWISLMNDTFVIKPEPIELINEADPISIRQLRPTSVFKLKANDPVQMPKISGEIFSLRIDAPEISFVRRLFQSSDGDVWISVGDRLFQISSNVMIAHSADEGLPENMARMGEDAAGNLWIGGNSVLARLDRHGMITFDKADGAQSSRFAAISEGSDGSVYFANSDTYFARFDGTRIEIARPQIPKEISHIWTSRFAFVDSGGDFWMLSTGSLFRFSGVKNFADLNGRRPDRIYDKSSGLKSDGIFQIFEDSSGDIWVSTRGINNLDHGLARMKKGTDTFQTFTEADGFPPRRSPSAFAEDRFGNIWLTYYEGGLSRFDGERFEFFAPGEKLPEALLSDLLIDQKGRLWIGSTISGLIRVDDTSAREPVFASITTRDGLSSNNIRTITEDRFGRIYVGTASGVDRVSPETGHVKHFSVDDGLAADFVVDSHLDRDGNVWFATGSGVSRLAPKLDDTRVPPGVFIGSLRVAGVEQPVSNLGTPEIERGELVHTENNLQIEFFGLDFRAGETLRYQYKLEGADTDWSPPTEQRSVTFANLSPSSYRFLVRAISSEGVQSEKPAVVSFRILPPIWARWWFIALVVLGIALLVTAFYGYRLARLREVNAALEDARLAEENLRKSRDERLAELEQVRSRIATDLHDDIGASLTQIAILSEVAQAQSKNGDSEPLKMITNVSNELVGTMSDIVWSINPTKDHFSDLTQRMRRLASDVLAAKGIGLNFNSSHSDDAFTVNSNIRREVFLIFKETINNIVKHSAAERVQVDVGIVDESLRVIIRDDGCGFRINDGDDSSGPDIDGGNGIPSMRKRALEMRGRIDIESSPGAGTSVTFSIPVESTAQTGGETVGKKP
ncbi:MAG: hypothetical protein IPN69_19490 [Acidobacteria bacterium]|nr:hypothetical protein [Acidobacteriota bacterium]